jgi:hypothetical protein
VSPVVALSLSASIVSKVSTVKPFTIHLASLKGGTLNGGVVAPVKSIVRSSSVKVPFGKEFSYKK